VQDSGYTERRRPVSPSLAAILSFFWPGLGQYYARRRTAALLFALPVLVVAVIALYEARRGAAVMVARLLDPHVAAAVFVTVVVLGLWRLLAVMHAYRSADVRLKGRFTERMALAPLVLAIVVMHVVGASYLLSAYQMDVNIFDNGGNGAEMAAVAPTGSRITVLLTGVDQYSTRAQHLYDSLMVVSVDTKAKTIAMVSVPRDTAGYPQYWGGTGKIKINAIPTYVRNGWLDSGDEPLPTLVKEISYLVGVPINYYGVMDLGAFMKIIDLVGGVDINNESAINDPSYDWMDGSPYGFALSVGPHHLNGRNALAYTRSRHGYGNSDYARAARQQQVLASVAHKMATPAMITKLPSLMDAAGSSVTTNFPASQVADMVEFAQSVPSDNYANYVLGPPYSVSTATATAATSCLDLGKVAPLSVKLFGTDSRYYGKTQPSTC
jgi:LCP family protein required for cell wall assembly